MLKGDNTLLFTSECVNRGHPDKICDQISDAVLDACLSVDPGARVACETCIKNNFVMVFGEVTTTAKPDYGRVIAEVIKDIGYNSPEMGLDWRNLHVQIALTEQDPEIARAVHTIQPVEEIGAGDQGLMFGYATNETAEFMPLTQVLSSKICRRLEECRLKNIIPYLRPDGKSQVTVEYDRATMRPLRVHTVLISTQHNEGIELKQIQKDVLEKVVKHVVPSEWLTSDTIYHLNPSGSFTIGGPVGDAGLTGRKIIVDTYGGWGAHGGGAFSGKDPTKVDRSAAYAARWAAKSLVAGGLCSRVLVQLSYAIGVAHPISLNVNSYATVTAPYTDGDLERILMHNFDFRPGVIIRELKLTMPIFTETASYGHFGMNSKSTWEQVRTLTMPKNVGQASMTNGFHGMTNGNVPLKAQKVPMKLANGVNGSPTHLGQVSSTSTTPSPITANTQPFCR